MNELTNSLTRVTAFAAALLLTQAAGAATSDGTVGTSSTGTVDVTIEVPAMTLVENLDPIALSYTPGGGNLTATEPFCVWATAGTLYDISISSAANPTGTTSFVAAGGSGNVSYTVEFDDDAAGTSWESVTEAAILNNAGAGYSGSADAAPGCGGGDNAALRITAAEAGNLDSAVADTYADELTLLVSPL